MLRAPAVSIIVPLYQCQLFLDRCICSITGQTLSEIEIILVDDGSTDESGKIADEYARLDSRVMAIHQLNHGPSHARNCGIKRSNGKYVGFVDSDDFAEPTMFKELYNIAVSHDADIAICNYSEHTSDGSSSRVIDHGLTNSAAYDRNGIVRIIIPRLASSTNFGLFSLWNKIYRTRWLLEHNILLDEALRFGEDFRFNVESVCLAEKVATIDRPLYHYVQQSASSLMHVYRENHLSAMLDGREWLNKRLSRFDISPYQSEYCQRFLANLYQSIIKELRVNKNKRLRKEKISAVLHRNETVEASNDFRNSPPKYFLISYLISKNNFELAFRLICVCSYLYGWRELAFSLFRKVRSRN